ncbi:hypothetical protein GCM10027579_09870 [Calidifontibacter terrae]
MRAAEGHDEGDRFLFVNHQRWHRRASREPVATLGSGALTTGVAAGGNGLATGAADRWPQPDTLEPPALPLQENPCPWLCRTSC